MNLIAYLSKDLSIFLFCGGFTFKYARILNNFPNSKVLNTCGPTELQLLHNFSWNYLISRKVFKSLPVGFVKEGTAYKFT